MALLGLTLHSATGFHAVHIPGTKYCIVIPTTNSHFLPMMNSSLVIGMLFHLNDAVGTVFLLAKMRLLSTTSTGGIRPATALSGVLLSQEMLCSVACAFLCLGFSITISIPTLPLVYRSETMYVFIVLTNCVACCYYRELDAFLVSAQKQPATRCSIGNSGLSRGNSGDGTSGTHRHHFDDSDLTGLEEPKIQYDEAALRRLAHWAKLNHRIKQDDVDFSTAGNNSPIVPTGARSDSKHQLGEVIQALPGHEENIEPADTHTEGDGPFASLKRRVSARKSKASNSSGAAAVQPDNLTTNSTVPPSPAPGLTDTAEELSLLPVLPPPAAPALRSHTAGEAVDHINSRSSSYDDRLGTLLHPKGSLLPGYGRSRAHGLELAEITQDVSNPATPASAVLPKDRTRNGFTALTPPPWQQKRKRPTPQHQHQHQHQHPAKRINRRSRGHRTSFCEDQSTEEVEDEDVRLAHAKLCSALMGLPLPEEEGLVR
ncbi:hypothetical protein BDZ90DRAFT_261144 [Jaminaea rosea]|uniref:Uncharacterized protein n=1 Tax=Jaminaea rosea TaxID=1569628 RepID=A0A316UNN9_9BASI|nr:hypothetical protein BDZ90DRAFT_261144 [Jaminaea rosea]PWN26889.1 hypothetical protein BDZ90DRAFT_261144 [Jaminaea rosea]